MPDPLAAALVDVEESKLLPDCLADTCDHEDDDPRHFDTSLGCGDAAAIRVVLAEQGYVIVNAETLAAALFMVSPPAPEIRPDYWRKVADAALKQVPAILNALQKGDN